MSLHRIFSQKKPDNPCKAASKPIRILSACILLATIGVVMKSAHEFIWMVSEIQQTVASEMPAEAEGAFYFIEPAKTATL